MPGGFKVIMPPPEGPGYSLQSFVQCWRIAYYKNNGNNLRAPKKQLLRHKSISAAIPGGTVGGVILLCCNGQKTARRRVTQ